MYKKKIKMTSHDSTRQRCYGNKLALRCLASDQSSDLSLCIAQGYRGLSYVIHDSVSDLVLDYNKVHVKKLGTTEVL